MSLLFTPLQMGSLRLTNRIALTAMVTRLSGEDGFVNQAMRDRYVCFARGEAGLIILEAMAVHGSKSGPLLRISADEYVPGLAELARAIHETSESKVIPQIIHFLKVARSGWRQTVDMLGAADLRGIVEAYPAAAYRARQAGMDGVELHMAHAYTLSSFLSKCNARTDEYGKGLEGRLRLPCEVLTAVRAAVGPDFPIGVRFLGDECIKGGYSTNEAKLIALRFAQLGVDYISLSAGGKFEDHVPPDGHPPYPYTGYSGDRCMPSHEYPDGMNLYMPMAFKRYLVEQGYRTPVLAAGKIATRQMAESVLAANALWPRPVSAMAIIGKAQAAMAAPAANRFKTLTMQETVTYPTSQSEISRWYEAPNRWRVEVRSGGQLQNVLVSNGTDMWNYTPMQKSVTISEAAPNAAILAGLSPLGEKVDSLADLLEQASRCYSPQMAGNSTVAGRAAYVITLKQTGCFSASIPNQGGQQTLWVDRQTYLVLKAVFKDRTGASVETREVTGIALDAPIPAETFSFAVPQGVTVWDARPKPASSGYAELVAQMQQLAKDADFPLFLPRAVPRGLIAGAPMRSPAGVEIAYSPTGTGGIEAGTVQMMQRKATPADVGGHPPDEQPMKVGPYPAWFLQGHKEADGTGLWSTLTVVRDGTRISFTSFDLGKDDLLAMAFSLEQVPGSHAPLPNPVPLTLAELRAKAGHPILVPTRVPAGLKANQPVGDDLVRISYVNEKGAVELDILNGRAGCCLDGDGRKGGQPVTIRSGITGHFLNNQPQFGGPILWWQEDGAYVAISGPHMTREALIDIANAMSPTANP